MTKKGYSRTAVKAKYVGQLAELKNRMASVDVQWSEDNPDQSDHIRVQFDNELTWYTANKSDFEIYSKWGALHKSTQQVLALPNHMTNRQVADLLNRPLHDIAKIRDCYGVNYACIPKDRGYKSKIIALGKTDTAKNIAAKVGCSVNYVSSVWRSENV